MFVFNPKRLRKQTIALLMLIAGGTLTVQVEWIKDIIIPKLANHPHLSSLATGAILFLTVLHSPLGQKVLESFKAEETTENPDGSKTIDTVETTKIEVAPPQ